ncbi:MAG TPA: hypothetical protein VFH40_11670 [Gemmatimonadales bacterium]|nr:hypothetical protein [Gemmatimonadales bacterium]
MCAMMLEPEPIAAELMLEPTLAATHDKWMAEAHRVLIPITNPGATFWERWDAVRYLVDRLPARIRLERELSVQLRLFLGDEHARRLRLQGERLSQLQRECNQLAQESGSARQLAARTKELLEAVRLWCAEFELATAHVPETAANDDVMRTLGRMNGTCIPDWVLTGP